jgi:hypothetical protein
VTSRQPFPWIFPYDEDVTSGSTHPTGRIVYRPVISITLVGTELGDDATLFALVDSGADRVLAAPGVARQIGVDPDSDHAVPLKIAGEKRLASPADVTLRLAPEPGLPGMEWQAEVGFLSAWTVAPWQVILGQVGFFDQFTVTFSRHALQLVIEDVGAFDKRYDTR